MKLKITTWNVNSVRFRIDLVAKFIKAARPDILCLQETKCPDDKFPLKRFKRLGYEHAAMNGQKGYHGVVVLSRFPFESISKRGFCGLSDSRHISVVLGEQAGLKDPVVVHNLYVPAGGDIPNPDVNPKFKHKLSFLDEMRECEEVHVNGNARSILLGDLNGVTSSFSASCRIRRLKPTNSMPRRRPAAGSMRCANWCQNRKNSIRGGAIVRPTGKTPTRAEGWITCGFRRH
jgi:exodeoxyribonuclease III